MDGDGYDRLRRERDRRARLTTSQRQRAENGNGSTVPMDGAGQNEQREVAQSPARLARCVKIGTNQDDPKQKKRCERDKYALLAGRGSPAVSRYPVRLALSFSGAF